MLREVPLDPLVVCRSIFPHQPNPRVQTPPVLFVSVPQDSSFHSSENRQSFVEPAMWWEEETCDLVPSHSTLEQASNSSDVHSKPEETCDTNICVPLNQV